MAYTTINKPTEHFNTKLYTGNGSTQSITGVGFQPDMIWQKERSSTSYHILTDAVRGNTKQLFPNDPSSEATSSLYITSFDSDGFSQGQQNDTNESGQTYASWNWKANGAGSSNTNGSITSTVSANTTAGFSIVKYVGTGGARTIGHGLNSSPELILQKNVTYTGAYNWYSWHIGIPATNYIKLDQNTGSASVDGVTWNNTLPTNQVFSVGTQGGSNRSGDTHIAYCFHSVQGYSKFGSYVGNGNADGTFIYTGFSPAFIITKPISTTGQWTMFDNKRDSANVGNKKYLHPNTSGDEGDANSFDFLSNGFKLKIAGGDINTSGTSYIYMAFAEAPLVGTNGVTAKAR
jgi:hypothetical protein